MMKTLISKIIIISLTLTLSSYSFAASGTGGTGGIGGGGGGTGGTGGGGKGSTGGTGGGGKGGTGGTGGGGTCSAVNIPNLATPTEVFNAMNGLANLKYDPSSGDNLGEQDPTDPTKNIIKYNLISNLQVAALGTTELAVLKPNTYTFNPDLIVNNAISSLTAVNATITNVGATNSQGLYTVELMKSWLQSLNDDTLYDKVINNTFAGMRIIERAELSSDNQLALTNASNNCSHFLAVSKDSVKSLRCVNYSTSMVSCETGKIGYVCLKNSIPKKISAEIKLIVQTTPEQLPILAWVNKLNDLQASSQASTNTIIQENMIFYKDAEDKIQCAVEVSSAFGQVTSIAVYNSKNYITVPNEDCADLYRVASFNPSYTPVTITTVTPTFLDEISGTSGSGTGGITSTTPIADMALETEFNTVKANPVRYSLNDYRSIVGFSSNTSFHMDPNAKLATAASLVSPDPECH